MNLHSGAVLEFMVCDRDEMDQSLNAAVDEMIAAAMQQGRQGVLVTRLGMGHFAVELSDAVPYGYTEQLDKLCPLQPLRNAVLQTLVRLSYTPS